MGVKRSGAGEEWYHWRMQIGGLVTPMGEQDYMGTGDEGLRKVTLWRGEQSKEWDHIGHSIGKGSRKDRPGKGSFEKGSEKEKRQQDVTATTNTHLPRAIKMSR